MAEHIVVVAAVIEQDGRFLVARRLEGTHVAGFWEFPGGKVQAGETHEEALMREIEEELGVEITGLRRSFFTTHSYPERTVELHFYRGHLSGPPTAALGQELRWLAREDFDPVEFPPADAELIEGLIDGDEFEL